MKIAIVTGEHGFQQKQFDAVFESMEGIQFVREDLDDFINDPNQQDYDTVVFYNFHRPYPTDPQARAILGLTERGQGMVILHHAILAFPEWDAFSEICGVDDRSDFGYYPRQTLNVQIADTTHPITEDLTNWEMGDETYTMKSAGDDSAILLTVDHPNSMEVSVGRVNTGNPVSSASKADTTMSPFLIRTSERYYDAAFTGVPKHSVNKK